MASDPRTQVNVSLVDGADVEEAATQARAVGMAIEQTLTTVGVLVGEIAASNIERLRALPQVADVEVSRTVKVAPPDSTTQ